MRIKPNADGHFCSWNSAFLYRWPVGQAVKTAASHAANGSSILPRVTTSEWTTFHSKSPASWNSAFLYRWPVGQAVKTAASHAANGSSILPRVTTSEWTTFHSKSPAIRLGFSHIISSFLLNPAAGENERPGRMNCILFKELSYFAGLFLVYPAKLSRTNKTRSLTGLFV